MAAGELDAYVTFSKGRIAKGTKRLPVDGETTDIFERGKNEEWHSIQVKRYDLGFTHDRQSTEAWGDEGSAPHNPTFEPVSFTKTVDQATTDLLNALYAGAVFPWVEIWQKKAGASRELSGGYFLKISLREVNISSLTWNASDGGSPEETVKLEFREIRVEYLPQKATGALDESASKVTSNVIGDGGGDYLTLETPDNKDKHGKHGKNGKNGATFTSGDKREIVDQVIAELKKYPNLKKLF